MCVWEKVNSSFVCWAFARAKTHAKCEWDHVWNDGLWIKLTLTFTLIRVNTSKLLILLCIPTWGVRYFSPCNDQIKEGWKSCRFTLS
jgi:hypothetical protein